MKSGLDLLLIEDNPGDARLIREILLAAPTDFAIVAVDTLKKGLRALQEQKFDIILLDLSLPDSYGIDTIKRIKVQAADTPIVVLTGLDDDAIIDLAVKAGAQDYLPKGNFDASLLLRSIRYAIERNKLLSEIQVLSLFDELTGLHNRRGFLTLAQHHFKIAKRSKKGLLLFFIDLDNMKEINDNLGHQAGDQALIDTALLLKSVFRDTDILARYGGDEFVVLAVDADASCKDTLLSLLKYKRDELNKQSYSLSMSTGVVYYDFEAERSLEELLSEADALMYQEKQAKKRQRANRVSGGANRN